MRQGGDRENLAARSLLRRGLKSSADGFRKLLGHRGGTHIYNDVIDPARAVEMDLVDRLELLARELALKDK